MVGIRPPGASAADNAAYYGYLDLLSRNGPPTLFVYGTAVVFSENA